MKLQRFVLLAGLLALGALAQAQQRFTVGWVAGAGTTATHETNRYYSTAQYTMAAGVDVGFRVWHVFHLTGRAEYQKRYYLLGTTRAFFTSDQVSIKNAVQYQAGISVRGKHFYGSAGPTYSDNLSRGQEPIVIGCGMGFTDAELKRLTSRKLLNAWGWYANVGYRQPLSTRASALVELGYLRENRGLNSYVIDPLRQFSLRVGSQYQF